jgi:hypothetical protein
MPKAYTTCPYCNKSNQIIEHKREEQNCVFCGQPFMISHKKETKLLSEPESIQKRTMRETPEQREPIDVNQTKPINKNKRKPLR